MSRHVDDRLLNDLLSGELSEDEERATEEHLRACPGCVRQLDEWQRVFPQVRRIIPTGPHARIPETRADLSRLVLPPGRAGGTRPTWRPVWLGGALVVAALGGAMILARQPAAPPPEPVAEITMEPGPAPGAASEPASQAASLADVPTATLEMPPRQEPVPVTTRRAAPAPPSAPPVSDSGSPAPPAAGPSRPDLEAARARAVEQLGGAIRLLDGRWPERFAFLDGAEVPGADPARPVIRLVYHSSEGSIILDQQRQPAGPAASPASGTAPDGVAVVQWVDAEGFWVTLAGRLPEGRMMALRERVR